ncbi:MAG: anthranilate phosphoribosyltransferase, partial [Planctomycetes bacterium]|nr:anthranilate phosphoribosyltransferase [Planctomycetota bacterium]
RSEVRGQRTGGATRPTDAQIGLFLTSLRAKGETFAEVAGAAEALRRRMVRVRTQRDGLIDTCGTGGDGSRTFNISTAAAIVTAAAGVPVAKHGNRSITSRTGSADVLAALGVNVEAPPQRVESCLDELGIGFCFAPLMHPSMKAVAAVRRQLGVPTIFNLLGPLCNPAAAPFQVIGVGRPEVHRLMAESLALLGIRRAIFVRGEDALDEVSLAGVTHVIEVRDGTLHDFRWTPEDFGLKPSDRAGMLVDSPQDSAAVIRAVLAGERGPPRDIVLLNAAAALWTAGKMSDLRQAAAQAAEAIDSGAARELLSRWADRSH